MEKEKNPRLSSSLKRLIILAAVVLVILAVFRFTPLDAEHIKKLKPAYVKEFLLGFGVLAPVLFVALYALRGVILIIPVGVMSWTGGLTFGLGWGTLLILIGATLGSCLSFLVARYFGRGFIESMKWFHKGRIKTFDEKAAEHGFKLILFVRLIPLFQYDAVNFGGGLSKVKLRDFALGSFIGMVPGAFINANIGASLENVMSVQFFVAIGAFLLLMLVPLIYRKIKKSPGGETAGGGDA